MMAHRLRRWANIKPTRGERLTSEERCVRAVARIHCGLWSVLRGAAAERSGGAE